MSPNDTIIAEILLLIGLAGPVTVRLIAWPSMRNYMFVNEIPITVIAFVLGCFFVPFKMIGEFSLDIGRLIDLISLLLVSLLVYTLVFIAVFFKENRATNFIRSLVDRVADGGGELPRAFITTVVLLFAVGAALLAIAYAGMGFIPAFADNPFAAKYFTGVYAARYRPWAPVFRTGIQLFQVITPFFFIAATRMKFLPRAAAFLLFIVYSILVLFSLGRSYFGTPILITGFLFFTYFRKGKYAWLYGLAFCFIFCFGTLITPIISDIINNRPINIDLETLVSGASDVHDLLWFWDRWELRHWTLSLGRTVYGALMPYHYDWNPAVVTLKTIGTEPGVGGGGGFRLPPAVNGLIAFGWVGALLKVAFYGFWDAVTTIAMRHAATKTYPVASAGLMALVLPNVLFHFGQYLTEMSADLTVYLVGNMGLLGLVIYARRSKPSIRPAIMAR